jgi:hypothetical protein
MIANEVTQLARKFATLDERGKLVFLAKSAFHITMCGRGTYEPGTTRVIRPEQLRRTNELVHRISQFLLNYLENGGRPTDNEFIDQLVNEAHLLGYLDILLRELKNAR